MTTAPLRIAIVAGEESGDQLGGALMEALNGQADVVWSGVGGARMEGAGLRSLFPMEEIAVMGFDAIVRRLPALLSRIAEVARAVERDPPDVLILVDAPEFTHRVAKRVRRRLPHVPIVNYVSPTVWAWRPGRAPAMRAYVDLVLALFPFEPAVHAQLGGPRCVYVGHPLYEGWRGLERTPRHLLVLPGSRRLEIDRLMPLFGAVLSRLTDPPDVVIAAVPRHAERIADLSRPWPIAPRIVSGEADKRDAFAGAIAALAASGTVTLELAAARVPMVVAYKLDLGYKVVKRINRIVPFIVAPSIVLANIVIGRNALPAFLDDEATPDALAAALAPLLSPDPTARDAQADAFDAFETAMQVSGAPAEEAARAVLTLIRERAEGDAARRAD